MNKNPELFAFLESNPGCVMLLAADGLLLGMNFAGLQAMQADSFGQIQNQCIHSSVMEEDRTALRELMGKVFRGESGTLEFRIFGLKGALRRWEMLASPVPDDDGRITAMLGIARDIPAIKRDERNLLMLGLALDKASSAVFLIDKNLRFTHVNEAACRSLGYTREELLGKSPPDIDPDISREAALEMMENLFANNYYGVIKARHRTREGQIFPVEISASVFEYDGSKACLAIVSNIADRKQTDRQLALLDLALNNVREGAFLTDENGRFRYVNAEACRALGYSREELLAMSVSDIDPDFHSSQWPAHWRDLKKRGSITLETRHRTKDGRPFPVEVNANYFEYEGQCLNLALVRDITERKQMEADRMTHLRFFECMDRVHRAIQGATSLEQMMQDVLNVVLSIFDGDRVYLMYPCDPTSATWTSPMECTKPEYPGVLALRLVVPMDPETAQTVRTVLDSDGPVKFGPGAAHPLPGDVAQRFAIKSVMAMAIRPKVSKPWQFGIHQCSYERIWTLDEERLFQEIGRRLADGLSSLLMLRDLRENESRLAEAERIAHVGYWERDFDEKRVTFSDEARRILGLPAGEKNTVLSEWHQRWLELLHPDDRERASQAFAAALRGEQDYDVEYRVIRPDGEVRTVRSHGEATRDQTGKPHRMFGIVQDITELRQLEERFRQSQKMEAIGQLAGGVAHDFNNILTSILMQVELGLAEGPLSPDLSESLHQIHNDAERAANLTRQLLLFSRRQVMQPRDLDLNEVVTNLAKMLQRIIGEDVRLQLLLNPAPLVTHADAGMVDQVLMNLAVNARDAMPEGGRLIIETSEKIVDENLARTNPDATPGRYTCLSVSDSGCGIPPEVLPRIFEPFFTTKEPGKGTGLGLATVFGIVKQHRGWIKVYSEDALGTTFQVFLPASGASAAAAAEAARPKPRGGTETILFAEDEMSVRKATRTILVRYGYNVLEAANGVEALELWKQHRATIALLLTDLVMPANMTGLQLAGHLQADNRNLKVIFTSGHSAEIAGRQIELRTGDNFLQKPFSPEQLLKTIRSCLDG